MSTNTICNKTVPTTTDVVDDAVGVSKSYWFVAIVNHNSEKQSSEKLSKMGVVNYLPTQTEIRVWRNGRKSKVDRVVIPSTVFVYCTEQQRRDLAGLPFINRFMSNKAGTMKGCSRKPLATIPDQQIDILKFMLGNTETPVTITSTIFKRGDQVRVRRGQLMGLEGEVFDISKDKSELIVRIDMFGCARLNIDTVNIELLDNYVVNC